MEFAIYVFVRAGLICLLRSVDRVQREVQPPKGDRMNALALTGQREPGNWFVSVAVEDGEYVIMKCANQTNAETLAAAINTYALRAQADIE